MRRLVPLAAARRLRPLAGWVGRRYVPKGRAVILMYHRIAEPAFDPWRICVSERYFDEHLAELRAHFRPLSLGELASSIERGTVPPRAVAVTFDDGYRDTLEAAKPALERHGIPATVFVAAGYVGSGRDFWWLELERICFAGTRPRSGPVAVDPLRADWSERTDQLYLNLWRQLQLLPHERRRELLDELAKAANWTRTPSDATLSAEQLVELGSGELVEIGGHTVNHPSLPSLSADEQLAEMRQGRVRLEEWLGRPVTSFSFPHGAFTEESVRLAREAGFARACVSVDAAARPGNDIFQLPRRHVDPWRGDEFAWQLSRFFR
jgi:peptidoglycan/xylan/chitin deacetylase (PgdA/CDA1 family)